MAIFALIGFWKMRTLPTLFLLLLIPCFVFSVGCRARRCATCTCESSNSSYWAGCEDCDDSEQVAVKSDPDRYQSVVEDSDSWGLVSKSIGESSGQGDSACNSCDQTHEVLVDGMCADCMKAKLSDDVANQGGITSKLRTELSSRRTSLKSTTEELVGVTTPHEPVYTFKKTNSDKLQLFPTTEPDGGTVHKMPTANEIEKILENKLPAVVSKADELADVAINNIVDGSKTVAASAESSLENTIVEAAGQVRDASERPNSLLILNAPSESVAALKKENVETLTKALNAVPNQKIDSNAVDPRFETFKLEDLFRNNENTPVQETKPMVVVKGKTPVASKPVLRHDRPVEKVAKVEVDSPAKLEDEISEKMVATPAPQIERVMRSRSEEEVIRDLRNSTIPTKLVFDNSPEIPQQKNAVNSAIVLKASPVEYYHEIQQLVQSKSQKSHLLSVPVEIPAKKVVERKRRISVPTRQASSQRVVEEKTNEMRFDFQPLPHLNELVEPMDLSMASSISNEVFQPYEFPEEIETPAVNEHAEIKFDSLAPGESVAGSTDVASEDAVDESSHDHDWALEIIALPVEKSASTEITPIEVSTQPLPPVENINVEKTPVINVSALPPLPVDVQQATVPQETMPQKESSILLRAIPKPRDDAGRIRLPRFESQSQAKFRFVQPKFQRVGEEK